MKWQKPKILIWEQKTTPPSGAETYFIKQVWYKVQKWRNKILKKLFLLSIERKEILSINFPVLLPKSLCHNGVANPITASTRTSQHTHTTSKFYHNLLVKHYLNALLQLTCILFLNQLLISLSVLLVRKQSPYIASKHI